MPKERGVVFWTKSFLAICSSHPAVTKRTLFIVFPIILILIFFYCNKDKRRFFYEIF